MRTYKKFDYCYPVTKLLELYPKDAEAVFLADVFGTTRQTITRWRNKPDMCFHVFEADRFAIKIGVHPVGIWHDWYEKQLCNTLKI